MHDEDFPWCGDAGDKATALERQSGQEAFNRWERFGDPGDLLLVGMEKHDFPPRSEAVNRLHPGLFRAVAEY